MKINVFGKQDCSTCKQMHEKMLHCIEKWNMKERVTVNYINMDTIDGMAEAAFHDIAEVPTVVVEKDGSAVARYDGGVSDSRQLQLRLQEIEVGNIN